MGNKLTIENNRQYFWQWDVGQRLVVADSNCREVHFYNGGEGALTVDVYQEGENAYVNVPDILLQNARGLEAFLYITGENEAHTILHQHIDIRPRPQPLEYACTPTEILSWRTMDAKMKELLEEISKSDYTAVQNSLKEISGKLRENTQEHVELNGKIAGLTGSIETKIATATANFEAEIADATANLETEITDLTAAMGKNVADLTQKLDKKVSAGLSSATRFCATDEEIREAMEEFFQASVSGGLTGFSLYVENADVSIPFHIGDFMLMIFRDGDYGFCMLMDAATPLGSLVCFRNDFGWDYRWEISGGGEQGHSGIYVGAGDMPDGYDVQIDPNGEALTLDNEMTDDSENVPKTKVVKSYVDEKPIKNHRMFGNSYGSDEEMADGIFYSKRYYYVDNIAGNDDNAGDRWGSCFKTLKKALDTANADGNHDTRIALAQSDTPYDFPYSSCAINGLHITGYTCQRNADGSLAATPSPFTTACNANNHPPVTIHFSNPKRPVAFYCGHVNFKGVRITKGTVTASGFETKIYADGGMIYFNYCEVDTPHQQNGGTLFASGSYFSRLQCEQAIVKFFDAPVTFKSENIQGDNAENPAWYRLVITGGSGGVQASSGLIFEGENNGLMYFTDTFFSLAAAATLSLTSTVNANVNDLKSDNSLLFISTDHWNLIGKKRITDTLWVGGNSRLLTGTIQTMNSDGSVNQGV